MPRSRRRRRSSAAPTPPRGATPVEHKLDLHGDHVAEALPKIERHIQLNYAAGQPWVHIVHGRGTGTLRAAVQDFLRNHRLVARYRYAPPTMGGDGVTIADLEYGQSRQTRREIDSLGGPVDTTG